MKNHLLWLFCAMICSLQASHLKGGEILAHKDPSNPLKYNFEIVLVYDATNITTDPNQSSLIDVSFVTFNTGDGSPSITVPFDNKILYPSQNLAKITYKTSHMYANSGTYTVSMSESWRIGGILNMGRSGETDVYLETKIVINTASSQSSPVFNDFPPISAYKNSVYSYTPSYTEADGDSIAFELTSPLKRLNTPVDDYVWPNDTKFGFAGSFSIDPKTGTLTWDRPGQTGFYAIAYKVFEYRNKVLIGTYIRDYTLMVLEGTSGITDHSVTQTNNLVYPNPRNQQDVFFVNKSGMLKIYNSMGKMVYENNLYSKNTDLRIDMNTGVYEIQLSDERGTHRSKLVVK